MCAEVAGRGEVFELGGEGGNAFSFELNAIVKSVSFRDKKFLRSEMVHALISDIEMDGLKMLDIDSMIGTKRITRLKKFLEDYQSTWKTILDKLLSPVGDVLFYIVIFTLLN